jgi:hypothetical protein
MDNPISCRQCGRNIDPSGDTPGANKPCPACGSTERIAYVTAGPMQPSNYFLDRYVAHKLSQLTECGAPELPTKRRLWLGDFISRTWFIDLPEKWRAYVFNFLRRTEGALAEYDDAREALIEYLNTSATTVSPYFRSLLAFEVCISQLYQGIELLSSATGRKNFFMRKDGSVGERLFLMYNDSKHMNERIERGDIPAEATSAVWITNAGLESSGARLTFAELHEELRGMIDLADSLLTPLPRRSAASGPAPEAPQIAGQS